MKNSSQSTVRSALDRADIPLHAQREVYNTIFSTSRNTLSGRSGVWTALLMSARHARTMVKTNRSKWAPDLVPLYEEYVDILSTIVSRIQQTLVTVDVDGQPVSLETFTRVCAQRNLTRQREGKPESAVCNGQWQSWIAKTRREEFALKVEQHYAAMPVASKGGRFTPFFTRELRAAIHIRTQRLNVTIQSIRRQMANCGTAPPMANTPYAALYLAAARMAERRLAQLALVPATIDTAVPVNWLHLLDAPMRARLQEAGRSPEDVDTHGLSSFYLPPGQAATTRAAATPQDAEEFMEGMDEVDEVDDSAGAP